MCLIVYKPEDASLPGNILDRGYRMNDDGFGIMYPKGDGTLRVIKGVFTLKIINQVFGYAMKHNVPLAMHFRMRTHGLIDVGNCHPFRVLNKEEHGRDLCMMHNGILRVPTDTDHTRSDSWHFVHRYLAPVLRKDPSLIDDEAFRRMISDVIGNWNKLTFMDGDGKTYIINRSAGTDMDGAWFSSGYWSKDARIYADNDYDLYS